MINSFNFISLPGLIPPYLCNLFSACNDFIYLMTAFCSFFFEHGPCMFARQEIAILFKIHCLLSTNNLWINIMCNIVLSLFQGNCKKRHWSMGIDWPVVILLLFCGQRVCLCFRYDFISVFVKLVYVMCSHFVLQFRLHCILCN